jgi:hypothetical protein
MIAPAFRPLFVRLRLLRHLSPSRKGDRQIPFVTDHKRVSVTNRIDAAAEAPKIDSMSDLAGYGVNL